jgi:hypothetical protein
LKKVRETYKWFHAQEQITDTGEAVRSDHLTVGELSSNGVIPQTQKIDVRVFRVVALLLH